MTSWLILRGLKLVFAFLGIELVSYDFHECQIRDTSYSCFDGSVKFERRVYLICMCGLCVRIFEQL